MADPTSSIPDEDDFPGHLLHRAALWDNAELLTDLLNGELKAFIGSQDSWGRYPIHAAATTDASSCLGILLETGADPNSTSGAKDNYMTPLHVSSEHGFLSNVERLVKAGADVNRRDGRNLSALDLAERGGHVTCYEYLKSAASLKESSRLSLHTKLREAAARFDLDLAKNILDSMEACDIQSLVNETTHGSNTLLFKAAEAGNKQLVELLCENGADGRVHQVTKYSPLYIACYYGHRDVVTYLLDKFPALTAIPTVEKWLPLHAACINGHAQIVDIMLKHKYPSSLYKTYKTPSHSNLEIELPFDVNLKDVSGQTALYIVCQMGNQRIVDLLLRYKVEGKPVGETKAVKQNSQLVSPSEESGTSIKGSPTKKRVISEGIQGIMSKLSLASSHTSVANRKLENLVCPFDVNMYCEDYQTALHAAVKGRHAIIASLLLQHGADPNAPIKQQPQSVTPYEQVKQNLKREEFSTALAEACQLRDLGMVDILLKFGARDDDCKALAVSSLDDILIGKILALKAHQDSENKINIQQLKENIMQTGTKKLLLINTILPSTPVTVNWHCQKLSKINENWLIMASLKINPKLRLCLMNQSLGLQAITRLDLSSNNLESIPSSIFTLCSLVFLNLSQNKISSFQFPTRMCVPALEEVLLHENRIEQCPPEFFTEIPNLMVLNLANNKLIKLPASIWECNKLQDLNLSLNLLTDLPQLSTDVSEEPTSIMYESLPYFSGTDIQQISSPKSPESQKVFAHESDNDRSSSPTLKHQTLWRQHVQISNITKEAPTALILSQQSSLISLNLSHNSFRKVPKVLACLAPQLQRLNMSYNHLRQLGRIGYYPASLKQLDISHNNIEKWFYLIITSPGKGDSSVAGCQCYSRWPATSYDTDMSTLCVHKEHARLDQLKSLLLGGNLLKQIDLGQPEVTSGEASNDKRSSNVRNLWFPNITLLDLQDNKLIEVTKRIAELRSLSVLNLSGNCSITELPPELGTLKHLWNLNLNSCTLQEPLASMVERKRYKTMDIVGYLKSVLENSKPYRRMKLMIVGNANIGKTTLLLQMRQESSSGQQKHALQQDHWAKRMSLQGANSSGKLSPGGGMQKSGKTISTVGVDIASWALEPRAARSSGHGPVILRTWDFAGQREYYATHLYFLSRRSLYVVVWNICDGEKGVNELVQWLINIQSRAPNSPVILVGTHYDLVSEKFPPGYFEYLQQKIRERFICVTDPEKRGLPRIIHSIEVSCKTRYNIKYLTNLIYETVWNLRTNNGKILLEQKIPSKYIHMEEITAYLAQERKSQGLEPIVTENEFKTQVSNWLKKGFGLTFRDDAEIMQACQFLHENGILLHFEDSVLHDLYFLDPQSLCDMLANIITIKEINPFVKNGLMNISDLSHLFKGKLISKDYVLSLLSKFELAIPIDKSRLLLIPSLLPTYDQMKSGHCDVKIKINVRSRRRIGSSAPSSMPSTPVKEVGNAWTTIRGKMTPISRFVLLSYFPSGFWSRLITRIVSDIRIPEILHDYFTSENLSDTPEPIHELNAEWVLWQTGLEINYGPTTVLYIKEVTGEKPYSFMLRRDETVCEIVETCDESSTRTEPEEQVWEVVDLCETSLLEITLQASNLKRNSDEAEQDQILLEPSMENVTKLFSIIIEHLDTLLEDWYPSIGTRFIHTSEGKYLVTRLIPCPRCFPNNQGNHLNESEHQQRQGIFGSPDLKSPRMSSDSGFGNSPTNTTVTKAAEELIDESVVLRTRTGLIFESPKFSSSVSFMSGLNYFLKPETKLRNLSRNYYAWTVEHCILESQKQTDNEDGIISVKCPKHGGISLREIAPDILFLDLNENSIIKMNEIQRNKLLGRGAFGFVFSGTLKQDNSSEIAIKTFHPTDPTSSVKEGESKSESLNEAQMVYKLAFNKWHRSPSQSACRAYQACRGEVRVLYFVKHDNIVPFVGLCQSPLSIILKKAPYGSLNKILNDFKRSGDHLKEKTLRCCLLQIASALDYLHRNHIIYKDLKSENVLCWKFPPPFGINDVENVDVKLADYGISRSAFNTGATKGFGGTEGFMAPEIIRFNGEEEYTEKVDIFSFAMVLYELITLKQPFDNYDNIKETILDGERPKLTEKECNLYPSYILDLMVICWSSAPNSRPSAAEIVTIVNSTEFLLLRDVISINGITNVVTSIGIEYGYEREVWTSCSTGGIYCLKLHKTDHLFDSCHCFEFITTIVTAMCQIDNDFVWMGDTTGRIHCLRVSDYEKISEIDVEAQCPSIGAITSIESIGTIFVAVICSSGRLFLTDPSNGNVVTELGNSGSVHCLTSRSISEDNVYEVWTGEKAGQMTVFTIKNGKVVGQETVNHYEMIQIEGVQVLIINSHCDNETLFSYVYPGSVIYGWESENREMSARLDVGRLLPVRDTSMDDLSLKPLQVTLIHPTSEHIYIGTNWGFIFITDVKYLKPLTILQPFQEDIRSFWIFQSRGQNTQSPVSRRSSVGSSSRIEGSLELEISEEAAVSLTKKGESDQVERPSSSCDNEEQGDLSQPVVILGKDFSSIIQQQQKPVLPEEQKKKQIFAILWKVQSSVWN